ncbi:MAG: transposase [Alphaproteobacteria bacterium]|nr:transposase [Alphaproteobacteria bacterium]
MRASKRISISQFLAMLREAEQATSIARICRRQGISASTFRRWRKRFAPGTETGRHLLDENRRLKRHVTSLTIEKFMLQCIIRRKP